MPRLQTRFFTFLLTASALGLLTFLSTVFPARGVVPPENAPSRSLVDTHTTSAADPNSVGPSNSASIILAETPLNAALLLPRLTLTSAKPPTPEPTGVEFGAAETLRMNGSTREAVRSYLQIIANQPASPTSRACVTQVGHITEVLTPEGLVALEPYMTPNTDKSLNDDLAAVDFWFLQRCRQLLRKNADQLTSVLPALTERAWRLLRQRPEDPQIQTALDVALMAPDAAGAGEANRVRLSEYAASLRPCYLAWIIKTTVDNAEPPFDFVPTYEGKVLVSKYYEKCGGRAQTEEQKRIWYKKARDAAYELLFAHDPAKPAFDHCTNFLVAAEGLGESERRNAIDQIEEFLKSQPLTVTRWIARYELADFLTRSGNTAEDTHTGFQHFGELVKERPQFDLDSAVNDSAVDGRTRGLLVCVLGHGYAGTNRTDDAEACYQWVLDNFPYEVHPEETAAYSLAIIEDRKHYDTPTLGAAAYERFADAHPVGGYTPGALMTAAETYLRAKDTRSAVAVYERVARDFSTNATFKQKAEANIRELKRLATSTD